MPAGFLDLSLFQQVQPVRPVLHHAPALLDVLGMVIGPAHLIRVGVRELRLDPCVRVADLVERGRQGAPEAVGGQPGIEAHATQGLVQGTGTDALTGTSFIPQQVALGRGGRLEQFTGDLDGLRGERHEVGRYVSIAFTRLSLQLLDVFGGDDPQPACEIELLGRRMPQFAGAHAGEQQQA